MSKKFFPVKIDFLLNDHYTESDVYVKIGADFIHYLKEGDYNREELKKLKKKDCLNVYLDEATLQNYIKYKKEILERELLNKFDTAKCLTQFLNNYSLLKEFYTSVCLDEVKAEFIQGVARQSIQIIGRQSFLGALFSKFKKENPDQMIIKEMIAFFSIFALKYFDQIPEEQLEKFNVAILLTDILLNPEMSVKTQVPFSSDLDLEVLNHPEQVLETLPKEAYFKSSTIVNLIKAHHEKPDGSGYPNRLNYTRFDIFLCTYYISEQIVFKLIKKDLKLNELTSVYEEVVVENRKFSTPNFLRSFNNFDLFIKGGKK